MTSLLLAVMCMGTTCRDEPGPTYRFLEGVDLFPAQKSYTVGDTLWIQYANPEKRLYDQKTSQTIPVDTVSLTFAIGFVPWYDYPVMDPTVGYIDFVGPDGVKSGGLMETFGCVAANGYDFKLAVVPKQKGIYSLNLNGAPRDVTACSSRFSGFPYSSIEYYFDLADCNKDVFLSIPPYQRSEARRAKGTLEAEIDQKMVFYFKVE
jgi:hypothetical protein